MGRLLKIVEEVLNENNKNDSIFKKIEKISRSLKLKPIQDGNDLYLTINGTNNSYHIIVTLYNDGITVISLIQDKYIIDQISNDDDDDWNSDEYMGDISMRYGFIDNEKMEFKLKNARVDDIIEKVKYIKDAYDNGGKVTFKNFSSKVR